MILYEDAALVVLDKPAGLSSEEGVPAALRAHWNAPDAFVGVVHRLDTGVSGLMVYARTPAAAAALSRQVTQSQDAYAVQDGRAEGKTAAPQFVKQYRAVLAGAPDAQLPAAGVLRDYLFKDSRKGRVFPVSRPRKGVREAVLEYRILAAAGENSLAEITLHTGRTHQIRAHLESIGCPIVGDDRYFGPERRKFNLFADKLHLHAYKIDLSALYKKQTVITAPLPTHFKAGLEAAGLAFKN